MAKDRQVETNDRLVIGFGNVVINVDRVMSPGILNREEWRWAERNIIIQYAMIDIHHRVIMSI